jgi:hypothetical protein
VIEFWERLCEDVLKRAPHRPWVLGISNRLRIYFMVDKPDVFGDEWLPAPAPAPAMEATP